MPITIDAMTVHHITNEMVRDKPPFRDSDTWSKLQDLVNSDGYVMVAHNAAFDIDMLNKEGIEPKSVICTLKLARHFDKDGVLPKYGLQYLRYYLGLNVDATPTFLTVRSMVPSPEKHANYIFCPYSPKLKYSVPSQIPEKLSKIFKKRTHRHYIKFGITLFHQIYTGMNFFIIFENN